MSIRFFFFSLLRDGASGPVVKITGLSAGVWELIRVDGGHRYPSGMKHGAGRGHGRQVHDTYMTWPYFCVVTCPGTHECGQHPGLTILCYQALGSLTVSIIKTWALEYRMSESSIQFTPGQSQCQHLPQQYTESSYLSTESPEIPEKTMQPKRQKTEISQ